MKKMFITALMLFSSLAISQTASLFGGTVNAGSIGGTAAVTQGQSGAALLGLSFSTATQRSDEVGAAGGTVQPGGVLVGQTGASSATGGSASGALGFAAAGSSFGGGAANDQAATGTFGTLGISFRP
jgi:hypothetical protein